MYKRQLYDFFTTGTYDRNREFVLTTSPSMDILISSNLERLIYRIAGNSAEKNASLMQSLKESGKYEITDDMKAQLSDFYGNYATEAEDAAMIKKLYEDTGYVIDTHTAVAASVYEKYQKDVYKRQTCIKLNIVAAIHNQLIHQLAAYRNVAQLGRALRSGRRGRVFESRHSDSSRISVRICEQILGRGGRAGLEFI